MSKNKNTQKKQGIEELYYEDIISLAVNRKLFSSTDYSIAKEQNHFIGDCPEWHPEWHPAILCYGTVPSSQLATIKQRSSKFTTPLPLKSAQL